MIIDYRNYLVNHNSLKYVTRKYQLVLWYENDLRYKMHNVDIRKREIIKIIKQHKHIKQSEMAEMLGVTIRTVNTDLQYLKNEYYQITIKSGRYNGGVYWNE